MPTPAAPPPIAAATVSGQAVPVTASVVDSGSGVTSVQFKVDGVIMYFSNNGTAELTVNCTLLTGYQGMAGAIMLNQSLNVLPGFQNGFLFSASNTADPSDDDLGTEIVGVNCTLPPHAVINDTYLQWMEDNGVGT